MPPPDENLCLEFQYSELKLRGKTEPSTVTENIHTYVTQSLKLREDCIVLVQPMPSQFWVQKFVIYCANQTAKHTLMQRGLDIFGQHVDLEEPGAGVIRIEIQNAPGAMPGFIMKSWLENFGKVVNFDYEKYKFKNGKRIGWLTGTRVAYMKEMTGQLPPVKTFRWEAQKKDVQVRIWFYGQTDTYCRFCKETVPKTHKCDLAPKKKCYGCGGEGHFITDCKNPRNGKNPAHVEEQTGHGANIPHVQGEQSNVSSSKTATFPDIKKGVVRQNNTADEEIYGADSESDSPSRITSRKQLDPMAMFGKKPTRRKRKQHKMLRGAIMNATGEWLTDAGSDSDAETSSGKAKRKAKRKKVSKKAKVVKIDDHDDFKSALSHTEDDASETEKPTTEEGVKLKCPTILVTAPQDEEGKKVDSKKKEKVVEDLSPTNQEIDENCLVTGVEGKEEDMEEEAEDDENRSTDIVHPDQEEPMEEEPPQNSAIGQTDSGKSARQETQEVDYKDWSVQQQAEVSDDLTLAKDSTAQIQANVLLFGGSNCKRIGKSFIAVPSEVKVTTTNFCVGGQKISNMINKIHDLDKKQREKVTVAITHVGCVNFPCDEEEANHNFERYKEEVDMIHQECPQADIIMMGIIPRFGKSDFITQTNSQVQLFNRLLDGHKELNEKFYFLDSWKYLIDRNTGLAIKDLYNENDPEGLHLNTAGQEIIAGAWLAEVERLSIMHHERRIVSTSEGNEALTTQI